MRTHRFIGKFNFNQNRFKVCEPEILNQVKNVLRLKKGDKLILADGKLNETTVRIIKLDKKFLEVETLEKSLNQNEPQTYGVLYCSILKRENFEWVAQKATEIGIKEIVPLVSRRTVKLGFKKERLEKIIREAAEQSGRGLLPILSAPLKLEETLKKAEENDINLFFETKALLLDREESKAMAGKRIGVFIGPEGGWSEEELEKIKEEIKNGKNFRLSSLGKLTFRAETAAAIASWLIAQ